jgi:hypothetical protein
MSEGNPRLLQTPVLVLNATYEPINVTAVRRAIVLVLKGVATTEEENGSFVHSARVLRAGVSRFGPDPGPHHPSLARRAHGLG